MSDDDDNDKYARIEAGASLCVAWQLKNKPVVLIGGGQVASGRLVYLAESGARVTLICPFEGLCDEIKWRLKHEGSSVVQVWKDRKYESFKEDLEGSYMVLTAIDEVGLSQEICNLCRSHKIIVNVADVPNECDFYFGSMIRQQSLQIMFSTSGQSPRLARRLRQRVETLLLSPLYGQAIEKVGLLRLKLRQISPGVGGVTSQQRMKWMTDICDSWSIEELAFMNEQEEMDQLLQRGWLQGRTSLTRQQLQPWYKRVPFKDDWRRCPYHNSINGNWILPTSIGFALGWLTCIAISMRRN